MTRSKRLLPWLAAPLLGALGTLAYAPHEWFWLAPLVWAGLLYLLLQPQPHHPVRTASLLGALFGLGFFLTGIAWIYISLHTYGGMSAWLAALAVFLFCALMAAWHALIAGVFVRLLGWQRHTPLTAALLFGALWGLGDWLRGWVFSGFPWLSLGYSQVSSFSPLAGYFPLLGVFGVSLLTAWIAALALAGRKGWAMIAVLLLGGWGLKTVPWTEPAGNPLRVALLQGNIGQSLKWEAAQYEQTLLTYYRMVRAALEDEARPALVILPETAFPSFADQIPPDYLAALNELANRHQADILFGTVSGNSTVYHNSAVSLGSSPAQTYHKSHLVPFGEAVPFGFHWFMKMAHIPLSGFSPGRTEQAPLQLAGQQIAVNICYEDIFGEEIIRALPVASVLANLSNTAWFGDSAAQPQHLQIARARALETGRPMLRATNTGMTAAISPQGEVTDSLPAFTPGILHATVQGYQGETPYSRWGNAAFLLVTASFLVNALRRRPGMEGQSPSSTS